MPVPPKPPELRARANRPQAGEWVTLGDPYPGPIPPHPVGCSHERCASAWEAWWSDPVSGQWSEAQRDSVLDLAILLHAWVDEPSKVSLATEVRQLRHQLGLTPRGMRDLRWRYPEEVPEEPAEEKPKKPKPDPRLRAVSGE